jgi:Flp pilus assembly pilin Flp
MSLLNDRCGKTLLSAADSEKQWCCEGRMEAMARLLGQVLFDDQGQDVAEYAIMLTVLLVIVVGTVRLIGANANNMFSSVGSAIQ